MSGSLDNVDDAYPLTPAQQGMLYHSLSSRQPGVYLEQFTCVIEGPLDVARFQSAWDSVYKRHPALRTIFLWENLDRPLQVVRSRITLPWHRQDWSADDSASQEQRTEAMLREDRERGMNFADAPLARMFLARLAEDRWRFVWTFHHACLDGWSLGLVLEQVLREYGQAGPAPDPPPFSEFVRWLDDRGPGEANRHWDAILRSFREPVFPAIYPGPEPGPAGTARHQARLSSRRWDELQRFARQHRLTPNTVIHGAWAVLLSRFTGCGDLVFGSTVSGRSVALPDIESMVGCFLNTLPVRATIDPGSPVSAWLAALQDQLVSMREYEFSDLAAIQRRCEVAAGVPLFETIVVFENLAALPASATGASIRFSAIDLREQSNYALALQAVPGPDGLLLIYNHDLSRLSGVAIKQLADHFDAILGSLLSSATPVLRDLAALPEPEQERINRWSRGPALESPPVPVLEQFAGHARAHPGAPALAYRDTTVTYRDLDERSDRVAGALAAAGVARGDRVGLCVERSPDMVSGIFGILKAGAAYVPLDPSYPRARLEAMISSAGVAVLLARRNLHPELRARRRLDFERLSVDAPHPPDRTPQDGDLAYVIFTSGSTGRPKGVGVTHANLAASLAARSQYYRDPVGTFLLLSSFSFDSSVAGLFWTLCTGGALVLPEDRQELDLDALAGLVRQWKVTHTLCLPSLYRLLLDHAAPADLASLRTVIVAGEECQPGVYEAHRRTLPFCDFHNEYGPTEATVWCAAWQAPTDHDGPLPIGRPIPGARIELRDAAGRLVPQGVAGEVVVGGPGVAPGYLDSEAAPDGPFVPCSSGSGETLYRTGDLACWLPDGSLQFLGRADRQVKVRGHRVELGEIESALASHPQIVEAVVLTSREIIGDDLESLAAALADLDPTDAEQLLAMTDL